MNKDEKDYLEGMERESRTMATLMQQLAKRLGEVTEQRNRYWRETIELKRALERSNTD